MTRRRKLRGRATEEHQPGTSLERRTMPRYLRYDEIPANLSQPLRTLISRYELLNGKPLPPSIVFTSAVGGEGTTMVSRSFATLLAHEVGKFVCWVDCSWLAASERSPDDNADAPGLLEMLHDQSEVLAAFKTSAELPQLASFQPGRVPDQQRHMIVRSAEFEQLMNILLEEFDHVIFDTPPLLGPGDGLPLLRRSDGYFLVVKQRRTSESQVRRAIEMAAQTPNLGTVLTDFETKIPDFVQRLLGE